MDDGGPLPLPTRPDLLRAAVGAYLPTTHRPATWFSGASTMSFEARLEKEHDLTTDSARRLVVEYRRYLYLKAVHGGVLTPSKRVDQAWHLHMETPGLDWDRYCEARFGMRIEHFTGLSAKHVEANYVRTLDVYRQEFGQEPPRDIWPSVADQAKAQMAGWVTGLGFASFFLGMGIGIANSILTGETDVEPLSTAGGIVAAWLCYGGFGVALLGNFIARGTDLKEVARCG